MASFRTIPFIQGKVLQECGLLYIHCVSKDDSVVRVMNLPCLELVCREIHVSFIDKLGERRVALLPQHNGRGINIENLLENASSPVLASVISSCEIKVSVI
jgi:hypothetical protein